MSADLLDSYTSGIDPTLLGPTTNKSTGYDPSKIDMAQGFGAAALSNPNVMRDLHTYRRALGKSEVSDTDAINEFMSDSAWAEGNSVSAVFGDMGLAKSYQLGGESAAAMGRLRQLWDRQPMVWEQGGRGLTGVLDNAAAMLLDPLNLIPGSQGAKVGAKVIQSAVTKAVTEGVEKGLTAEAIKASTDIAIQEAAKNATMAALKRGAITDAAIGAAQNTIIDSLTQMRDVQLGVQDKFSVGGAAMSAALGAGLGGIAGAAFGAGGSLLGAKKEAARALQADGASKMLASDMVSAVPDKSPTLSNATDTLIQGAQAYSERTQADLAEQEIARLAAESAKRRTEREVNEAGPQFAQSVRAAFDNWWKGVESDLSSSPEKAKELASLRKEAAKARDFLFNADPNKYQQIADALSKAIRESVDPEEVSRLSSKLESLNELRNIMDVHTLEREGGTMADRANPAMGKYASGEGNPLYDAVKSWAERRLGVTSPEAPAGEYGVAHGAIDATGGGKVADGHVSTVSEAVGGTGDGVATAEAAAANPVADVAPASATTEASVPPKAEDAPAVAQAATPAAEASPAAATETAPVAATEVVPPVNAEPPAKVAAPTHDMAQLLSSKSDNMDANRAIAGMGRDEFVRQGMELIGDRANANTEKYLDTMFNNRSRIVESADAEAKLADPATKAQAELAQRLVEARTNDEFSRVFADVVGLDQKSPIAAELIDDVLKMADMAGHDRSGAVNRLIHRQLTVDSLVDVLLEEATKLGRVDANGSPVLSRAEIDTFVRAILPDVDSIDDKLISSVVARRSDPSSLAVAVVSDTAPNATASAAQPWRVDISAFKSADEYAAAFTKAYRKYAMDVARGDNPLSLKRGAQKFPVVGKDGVITMTSPDAYAKWRWGLSSGVADNSGTDLAKVFEAVNSRDDLRGIRSFLASQFERDPIAKSVVGQDGKIIRIETGDRQKFVGAVDVDSSVAEAFIGKNGEIDEAGLFDALMERARNRNNVRETLTRSELLGGESPADIIGPEWKKALRVARRLDESAPLADATKSSGAELEKMIATAAEQSGLTTEQVKAALSVVRAGESNPKYQRPYDAGSAIERLVSRDIDANEMTLLKRVYHDVADMVEHGKLGVEDIQNRVHEMVAEYWKRWLPEDFGTMEAPQRAKIVAKLEESSRQVKRMAHDMLRMRGETIQLAETAGHVGTLAYGDLLASRLGKFNTYGELTSQRNALRDRYSQLTHAINTAEAGKTDALIAELRQVGLDIDDIDRHLSQGWWEENLFNASKGLTDGDKREYTISFRNKDARRADRMINTAALPTAVGGNEVAGVVRSAQFMRAMESLNSARIKGAGNKDITPDSAMATIRYMFGDVGEGSDIANAISRKKNSDLMGANVQAGGLLHDIAFYVLKGDGANLAKLSQFTQMLVSQFGDLPKSMTSFLRDGKVFQVAQAPAAPVAKPLTELFATKLKLRKSELDALQSAGYGIPANAAEAWRLWDMLSYNSGFHPGATLSVQTAEQFDRVYGAMNALTRVLSDNPRVLPVQERTNLVKTVTAMFRDRNPYEQATALNLVARFGGMDAPIVMGKSGSHGSFSSTFGTPIKRDGNTVGYEFGKNMERSGLGREQGTKVANDLMFGSDGKAPMQSMYQPPIMRMVEADAEGSVVPTMSNRIVVGLEDRGVYELIHEMGHWGFSNVLSPDDQLRFMKSVRDRFYGDDGKFNAKLFKDMTGVELLPGHQPTPMELFAYTFERFVTEERRVPMPFSLAASLGDFVRDMANAVSRAMVYIYKRVMGVDIGVKNGELFTNKTADLAQIPDEFRALFKKLMPDNVQEGRTVEQMFPDISKRVYSDKKLASAVTNYNQVRAVLENLRDEIGNGFIQGDVEKYRAIQRAVRDGEMVMGLTGAPARGKDSVIMDRIISTGDAKMLLQHGRGELRDVNHNLDAGALDALRKQGIGDTMVSASGSRSNSVMDGIINPLDAGMTYGVMNPAYRSLADLQSWHDVLLRRLNDAYHGRLESAASSSAARSAARDATPTPRHISLALDQESMGIAQQRLRENPVLSARFQNMLMGINPDGSLKYQNAMIEKFFEGRGTKWTLRASNQAEENGRAVSSRAYQILHWYDAFNKKAMADLEAITDGTATERGKAVRDILLRALPDSFGADSDTRMINLRKEAMRIARGEPSEFIGAADNADVFFHFNALKRVMPERRDVPAAAAPAISAKKRGQTGAIEEENIRRMFGENPRVFYLGADGVASSKPVVGRVTIPDTINAKSKAIVSRLLEQRAIAAKVWSDVASEGGSIADLVKAKATILQIENKLTGKYGVAITDVVQPVFVKMDNPLHGDEVLSKAKARKIAKLVDEDVARKINDSMLADDLVEMLSDKGDVLEALKAVGHDAFVSGGDVKLFDRERMASIFDPKLREAPAPDAAASAAQSPVAAIMNAMAGSDGKMVFGDEATMALEHFAGGAPEAAASAAALVASASRKAVPESVWAGAANMARSIRDTLTFKSPSRYLEERGGMTWIARMFGGDFVGANQVGLNDRTMALLANRLADVDKAMAEHPTRDGAMKKWARNLKFWGDIAQSDADKRIHDYMQMRQAGATKAELDAIFAKATHEERAAEMNIIQKLTLAFNQVVADAEKINLHMGNVGPNYYVQSFNPVEVVKHRDALIDFFTNKFQRERANGPLPVELRSESECRASAQAMVDGIIGHDGTPTVPFSSKLSPHVESLDHHRVLAYSKDELLTELAPGVKLRDVLSNHLESNITKYFHGITKRFQWHETFGLGAHKLKDYMRIMSEGRQGIESLLRNDTNVPIARRSIMDTDVIIADSIRGVAADEATAARMTDELGAIWKRNDGGDRAKMVSELRSALEGYNLDDKNIFWDGRADVIANAIADFGGSVFGGKPQVEPQVQAYLRDFLHLAAGGSLHDANNKWHNASRILRNFNSVSLLGAATLTSIPDAILPLVRSGEFGAYMRAVKALSVDRDPIYMEFLRRTGVAMENIVHNRLANLHGGSSRWANAFFNANMLTPWTTVMRELAGAVAYESIRTWAKRVQTTDSGLAYRQAAEALEHFGLYDRKTRSGFVMKNSLDDPRVMGDPDLAAAIHRFAQESVFAPSNAEMPPWTKSPLGALAFQFKSYPLLYTRLAGYAWDQVKKGNVAPIVYLMTLPAGVAAGANIVKDVALSRGGDDGKKSEIRDRSFSKVAENFGFKNVNDFQGNALLGHYIEGFIAAGGVGMLSDLFYNTASSIDNGAYGRWRVASALFGPSVGTLGDGIQVAAGAWEGATGIRSTNSDERAAMRILAQRLLPVIGRLNSVVEPIVDGVAGEAQGRSSFGEGFNGNFGGGFGGPSKRN